MAEQRTHEGTRDRAAGERAMPERVVAGRAASGSRAEHDRSSELPSRKGGFERMAAEALRMVEATPHAEQPAPGAALEEIGAGMSRLVQETTRGLRAAMMLPIAPTAGFGEMQEAFAELITGMMRNNLRLAEEMMRIQSPQDYAALMQKIMRQWADTALDSQAAMLRMVGQPSSRAPGADTKGERPGHARG